eukprot:m.202543 g.202543  ORF g.202543 m.202543 type:complete len:195 (-) comp15365_c2_seq1:600-1184(-)
MKQNSDRSHGSGPHEQDLQPHHTALREQLRFDQALHEELGDEPSVEKQPVQSKRSRVPNPLATLHVHRETEGEPVEERVFVPNVLPLLYLVYKIADPQHHQVWPNSHTVTRFEMLNHGHDMLVHEVCLPSYGGNLHIRMTCHGSLVSFAQLSLKWFTGKSPRTNQGEVASMAAASRVGTWVPTTPEVTAWMYIA